MKRLLLMFLLLAVPLAQAAPAPVQQTYCSPSAGAGNTYACAFPSAVTAGDFLALVWVPPSSPAGSALTVTAADNVNGAWTANGQCFSAYSTQANEFYLANAKAGATTVTVTTSAADGAQIMAVEFSGMATSSAADGAAVCGSSYYSSTTIPGAGVTTTVANDLILANSGIQGNGGTVTVASPYTLIGSGEEGPLFGYQLATTAGAYTGPTFTAQYSVGGYPISAAYKAAGSPPPAAAATQIGAFAVGP